MAKKLVKEQGVFSFSDLQKKLYTVSPNAKIIHDTPFSNINEYFSTGNYALNAQISGDIFGGVPSGRVTLISGDSGCLNPKQKLRVFISKTVDKKNITNV